MDLLLTITSSEAGHIAQNLLQACSRRSCTVAVFMTNDGVMVANEPSFVNAIGESATVRVCEESWSTHCPDVTCPLSLGSQTNHSEFVAKAAKVVSL